MPNILMISYAWPPRGSVGMIRTTRFAKYLIRFGHSVTVVTEGEPSGNLLRWDMDEAELGKAKVYKVSSRRNRSLFCRMRNRINPQLEMDWFRSVNAALGDFLKDGNYDVIISSSPPESSHLIARRIKQKIKKPWIADLRDLWSHDHYRGFGFFRRKALSLVEEKPVLKEADRIVTVSEGWADFLKKDYGGRVRVITNGFDEDWFKNRNRAARSKFRISYLGKLNGFHQDISVFLKAVKDALNREDISGEKFEVNFYISGYGKPNIKEMVERTHLAGIVNERKSVSLSKAVDIMQNSDLLLLVGWEGLSAGAWRPRKLYEYLGSRTPMLLVNGCENTELAGILRSTRSGTVANNISDIRNEVARYYNDFMLDKPHKLDEKKDSLNEYTAFNVTKKLCSLIEEIKP